MIGANKIRNQRSARLLVYLGALLALLCLNATGESLHAAPTDAGQDDALGGHKYPWYDAETRSVKPLKQQPGNKPTSTERDTVPKAIKKQPGGAGGTANAGNRWGTGTGAAGEGSGTMLFIIAAATILVAIVVLVLTFLYIESSDLEKTQTSGRSRQQSIEQLPFDLETADGDFRSAADAAYRSGDLRKAIIYLYSHVLVTLDQNRLIRLRKGKTNRQYLREVQRHNGVSGYFQQVMLPFESVFFGDHEMDADQFQQCWSGLSGFHSKVKDNSEMLLG